MSQYVALKVKYCFQLFENINQVEAPIFLYLTAALY